MRVRAALFVLTLGLALSCAAQTYPSRAIRIVVAFPAGGGSDLAARVVAQKLSEGFGQPVVVENRVGANGSVGAEAVARSAPDGYTLVMGSNANITTNPHLMALSYDPMKDLAPVAMLTVNPLLLFVNPAVVPVASFREFLDLARQLLKPGGILYYNSTFSRDVQHTGASHFPYAYRFGPFLAVSDRPIQIDKQRWRSTLLAYRMDGKPILDLFA